MRKIRLKYPVKDIFGTVYEVGAHVQHPQEEQTVWTPPYESDREPTDGEKAQRQQFKNASDYARAAKADPEVWTFYQAEAQKQGRQPRNLAMSDYLNGKNLLSK